MAVFIIASSQIRDLYIAKSPHIDRDYINSIFDALGFNDTGVTSNGEKGTSTGQNLLGKLKWAVLEYENVRVFKLIEKDRIMVVLVNSNTRSSTP